MGSGEGNRPCYNSTHEAGCPCDRELTKKGSHDRHTRCSRCRKNPVTTAATEQKRAKLTTDVPTGVTVPPLPPPLATPPALELAFLSGPGPCFVPVPKPVPLPVVGPGSSGLTSLALVSGLLPNAQTHTKPTVNGSLSNSNAEAPMASGASVLTLSPHFLAPPALAIAPAETLLVPDDTGVAVLQSVERTAPDALDARAVSSVGSGSCSSPENSSADGSDDGVRVASAPAYGVASVSPASRSAASDKDRKACACKGGESCNRGKHKEGNACDRFVSQNGKDKHTVCKGCRYLKKKRPRSNAIVDCDAATGEMGEVSSVGASLTTHKRGRPTATPTPASTPSPILVSCVPGLLMPLPVPATMSAMPPNTFMNGFDSTPL